MLESISFVTNVFENRCKGLEKLQECLPLKVKQVLSRSKKLFIKLCSVSNIETEYKTTNNKEIWYIFLAYGMTGKVSTSKTKHSHIQFEMEHNWLGFNTFYYTDMRRIGSFEASSDIERFKFNVSDMGKPFVLGYNNEGFEPITKDEFVSNIKSCKSSYLATKIMDQRSIGSGIGNYLLSEIFHEANLHPYCQCIELSDEKISQLWTAINKVILEAYNHGGASLQDYVQADGNIGEFQNHLKVYKNKGHDEHGNKIYSYKGPHGRTIWSAFRRAPR